MIRASMGAVGQAGGGAAYDGSGSGGAFHHVILAVEWDDIISGCNNLHEAPAIGVTGDAAGGIARGHGDDSRVRGGIGGGGDGFIAGSRKA